MRVSMLLPADAESRRSCSAGGEGAISSILISESYAVYIFYACSNFTCTEARVLRAPRVRLPRNLPALTRTARAGRENALDFRYLFEGHEKTCAALLINVARRKI